MTRKLYYEDVCQREFISTISGIEKREKKKGGELFIELESTCFYPEGGGQPGDRGFIERIPVIDTRKEGERIVHVCELTSPALDLKPGQKVKGRVDWVRRFDFMQQHTGQHILSAALLNTADCTTVSVHQGDEYITIEIDKPDISREQIEAVEDSVNEAVCRNLPVKTFWIDEEDVAAYHLRRPPKKKGKLRLVQIDGLDCVACGGVHTETTGDVGLIKWISSEKIRNHVRLYWKIGTRAFEDYRMKTRVVTSINTFFSSKTEELPDRINNCLQESQDRKKRIDLLLYERAEIIAESLMKEKNPKSGDIRILSKIFEEEDTGFLKQIMKMCVSAGNTAACFLNKDTAGINWMVGVSEKVEFPFLQLKEELLSAIDGKGGGKFPFWQGRGKNIDGAGRFIQLFTRAF